MEKLSYLNTIGSFVFDELNRMPLWVVDDLIINPDNLKVEAFLIKDGFFTPPKVLSTGSISTFWKDIFVSAYCLKEIEASPVVKNILLRWIWVIYNKVLNEKWDYIGIVKDLMFTRNTFQWISIIVRPYLLGFFPNWPYRDISRKNIIDINKEKIIIKDKSIVKV